MLICLLSDGHILVEGMPGLAKTTAVKSLAEAIEGDFHRIQFTPDLLPADLIGTDIYKHEQGEFEFRAGPLFHDILLADEINRAPPKVQSALLEAMGERQITVGQNTYKLSKLFMVLATQNPVEHEGTYILPEAQLDRFLLYVKVDYPTKQEELQILELMENQQDLSTSNISTSDTIITQISQTEILETHKEVMQLCLEPKLKEYMIDIVQASRYPSKFDSDLQRWQQFGTSPQTIIITLSRCARALAWLKENKYLSPEYIQTIAPDILHHRILLSLEAEAESITMENQQDLSTSNTVTAQISQTEILEARKEVMQLYLDPKLKEYIVDIVQASRYPSKFDSDLQ
ncbi:MAG: AAA family ATPase, partial [Proteobacteria bacterium]|nr:AAA family ATPase [Pseudomonadota bacterium]